MYAFAAAEQKICTVFARLRPGWLNREVCTNVEGVWVGGGVYSFPVLYMYKFLSYCEGTAKPKFCQNGGVGGYAASEYGMSLQAREPKKLHRTQ